MLTIVTSLIIIFLIYSVDNTPNDTFCVVCAVILLIYTGIGAVANFERNDRYENIKNINDILENNDFREINNIDFLKRYSTCRSQMKFLYFPGYFPSNEYMLEYYRFKILIKDKKEDKKE